MTLRTRIKKDDNVEVRFATWPKMMSDLIFPKNFIGVLGRATGKTSEIVAERMMAINKDMPGCYIGVIADTYTNLDKNVIPELLLGWTRKGYKEGVDFVSGKAPPEHFLKPYKQPETYKDTISTRWGNLYVYMSMDRPTSGAGGSYQHLLIDEARNVNGEKAKKTFPANGRGFEAMCNKVAYGGITATTDIPNIAEGDYDWILDWEEKMDSEQIKDALQAGIILNKTRCQIQNVIRDKDVRNFKLLQKRLYRDLVKWTRARKKSTLFIQASTLANVGYLTPGYFQNQLDALEIEEFKSAILTFKPSIKKGEKFYPTLGNHHFYDDGLIKGYYDHIPTTESIGIGTSQALKYINHKQELDVGVDFGNMCSMIIGQEIGNYVYLLKELFTLAPEHTKELAFLFVTFFKDHHKKVLNMYYDRSGNQNAAVKKDYATELATFIEEKGWKVNLMNKNQATIFQEEEFNLMKHFFGGYNPNLPNILIDKFQCSNYKSSLELAKTKISKNRRTGSSMIQKDKSSEKLPIPQLPKYSTNLSDAGKYFFFRPEWAKHVQSKGILKLGAPTTG